MLLEKDRKFGQHYIVCSVEPLKQSYEMEVGVMIEVNKWSSTFLDPIRHVWMILLHYYGTLDLESPMD